MFAHEDPKQLTFKMRFADAATEAAYELACAETKRMARDAIEHINRSTGQHLYHIRMRNEEWMERLGFNRGGSRA